MMNGTISLSSSRKISLITAFFYLGLIVVACFYTWLYGDDYLNKAAMLGISPVQRMIDLYQTWDGRQLSIYGLIQMSILKWMPVSAGILVYLFFFLLFCFSAYFLIHKLFVEEGGKKNVSSYFFDLPVFASLLLISLIPYYKDVLFWLTGGAYMVSLFQAVLSLYVFQTLSQEFIGWNKIFKARFLFLLLFFFLISLNSQNITLPLLALFSFFCHKNWIESDSEKKVFLIFLILIFCLAMAVPSVAPGNLIRLKSEDISLNDFDLYSVFNMYFKFLRYCKWSVLIGLVTGSYFFQFQDHFGNKQKNFLQLSLLFFGLALLSMLPFMFTVELARVRTYFFGAVLLYFSGFFLAGYFTVQFSKFLLLCKFVPIIQFIACGFMIWQLSLMIPFSLETDKRLQFLESRRGSKGLVKYHRLEKPEQLLIIRWSNERLFPGWNHVEQIFDIERYEEI